MTAVKYFLAIDIGASSGRHILASIQNGVLVFEEIYRFENHFDNENGSLVWNIDRLENEVKNGIRKCKDIGKIPVSISIDTWGVDYVLLNKDRQVIKPVFSYRDSRTQRAVKAVENIIPFNELYQRTGIQKLDFNTIYQLYCDKKSGKLESAEHFLMIPDYLAFKLTGKMANEYTNATTTGLVNANTGTWDDSILESLDIPRRLFSDLTAPPAELGGFTAEMREYAGFDAKVTLCPSHDTASAVAGCPLRDDSLFISSGTWSLFGAETLQPILTEESARANFTNEGGIDRRFRYLKNYMGMWLFQNIRKEHNKKYSYDQMMEMAMKSSVVEYFDVNDPSLTAPDSMTSAINKLLGNEQLPLEDTLNCVYHSLAKSYRAALAEIELQTKKKISNIFIIGGGSKDIYLDRLTAEYTGLDVFIGLTEATAAGNLISQIMSEEDLTLSQVRNLVFKSFEIKGVKP